MLAQKYAAESTSEPAGSSSENGSHLHHNLQQFYAYSPLVSSSCGTNQYETNILDANNSHNDVIHVESTSGQIDSEDSQLLQSTCLSRQCDREFDKTGTDNCHELDFSHIHFDRQLCADKTCFSTAIVKPSIPLPVVDIN